MAEGGRTLRSASQTDLLLAEIKNLKVAIETSKKEVIDTLRKDIEGLRQTVHSLTSRVADLEQQNEDMKEKLQQFSWAPEMLTEGIIDECNQRRSRECNLFISGLPEAESESAEEAEREDLSTFSDIIHAIGVKEVGVEQVRRVGRSRGKRPLKVTLESVEQKWKVLKMAAKLRNKSPFSAVFINEDLTPMQQVQRKEQLKELKERRGAGEDVVLYRRMVIQRDSIKNASKNVPWRFFKEQQPRE